MAGLREPTREEPRGSHSRKPIQPLDPQGKRRELFIWVAEGDRVLPCWIYSHREQTQCLAGQKPGDTYCDFDPAGASPWPNPSKSHKGRHLSDFPEQSTKVSLPGNGARGEWI